MAIKQAKPVQPRPDARTDSMEIDKLPVPALAPEPGLEAASDPAEHKSRTSTSPVPLPVLTG